MLVLQKRDIKCRENEYTCSGESTSNSNQIEFNYSSSSNIAFPLALKNRKRNKCIPIQKFCDNFPDCENKEDEPQGCNECTTSEIRCR